MSNNIVLAVDTTSHTAAAASLAADLARGPDDHVVVLHVHEYAVGRFGRVQVDCVDGEGEKVTAEIVDRLRATGVSAQAEIRRTHVGSIARAILDVADERAAAMIILGSTSRRDLPRLPFGSVSLRLLHLSDRPVLIVPKGTAAEPVPAPAAPAVAGAVS
jgi:nucleotide-binding universal stress UspA family protein